MKDTRQDLLRLMLVKEEYAELISATDEENLIKELADLVYVTTLCSHFRVEFR